jgi:hypothetical protein
MACGSGSCGGGCGSGAAPPPILTALVLADEREARAVAEAPAPVGRWPGLDARGLDQVKLALLWALLAGEPFRDELVLEFAPLEEVSADGPWVFRVPPALAAALADVDVARAAELAAAWAACEELELDGWEPAAAHAMLDQLRGVARAAGAAGKPLLMWVSL